MYFNNWPPHERHVLHWPNKFTYMLWGQFFPRIYPFLYLLYTNILIQITRSIEKWERERVCLTRNWIIANVWCTHAYIKTTGPIYVFEIIGNRLGQDCCVLRITNMCMRLSRSVLCTNKAHIFEFAKHKQADKCTTKYMYMCIKVFMYYINIISYFYLRLYS